MVTINKIYTKNGDLGTSTLANLQILEKSDPRFALLGQLDLVIVEVGGSISELSSINIQLPNLVEQMEKIQRKLFDYGAVLALAERSPELLPLDSEIAKLEEWMDDWNKDLPPLRSFVLPQGPTALIQVHRTRAQLRILEQKLWHFNQTEQLDINLLKFFNRISDYFFVVTRVVMKELNLTDKLWETGKHL